MTLARWTLALSLAANLGFAPLALAQDAPPTAGETPASEPESAVPAPAPDNSGVEEIVVTITKRAESVQEIGGSIAAFDQEVIQNANIENVGDLIGLLPNVQVKSEDTDISIRGVARAAFDGQSPVAFHVNGIYHYNSLDYIGQFYDLQNVAIALGPSGTLYGRNANGGAIDVQWHKPTGQFEVIGDTTWAPAFDNYQFRTAVNVPLSGVDNKLLNARFALTREVQDGTTNNRLGTHSGSFGAKDDWSFRAFLRSEPTDNLTLELRSRYLKTDRRLAGGVNLLPAGTVPSGVVPLGAGTCSPAVGAPNNNCPFDWANGFSAFKAQLLSRPTIWRLISRNEFRAGLFPSINAALEDVLLTGRDLDGNPATLEVPPLVRNAQFFTPLPASRWDGSKRHTYSRLQDLGSGGLEIWDVDGSAEWNLSSLPLFGDVDVFFVGGYGRIENDGLSESDASDYGALDTVSGQHPENRGTFELRFQSNNDSWLNWTLGFFYLHNTIDQVRDTLTPLTISGASLTQDEVGYAPFANVTLKPIEPIEIFLGVRWNHDEFQRHEISNPTPLSVSTDFNSPVITWRETTLDAGIKWFVNDDVMVYAKWARGYKAGFIQLLPDPNGIVTPNDPSDDFKINSVDPETILATEIGAKTSWFDGRMNVNASAFHYDYSKLQVPVIKVVQIVNINAEKATVWGFELTVEASPIDNLNTRLAFGWLKAEFDKFCADEPLDAFSPPPVDAACIGNLDGGVDLSGNRLEDSPEFKVSLLGTYRWEMGSAGTITPTVEFTWTDDAFRRPQNNPLVDISEAYTKTDLRLRWEEPENRYWVEAFGENLEDNYVYPRGIVVALTGTSQGFGLLQPRTYGVRVGFNWGAE